MITDAPVGAAIDAWLRAWRARGGRVVEAVSEALEDADRGYLAAPLHARSALPAWRCAAMDGIAVRSAECAAPIAAGAYERVDTGQPVAASFDAVVPWERVSYGIDDAATVAGDVATGANVREAGEEVAEGTLLLLAGALLTPERLALAAACGHGRVHVRRPRVVVVPTGDEVRPAGSLLEPGEVADSNSVMLALLACDRGAVVERRGIIPDDPPTLAAAVRDAAASADLVCVIAGSARGGRDHTRAEIGRASCRERV